MSKNALALLDCNNREQLYQFLVSHFDRKAVKNEMISPYDDQLIGKMNFRYGGMEHAMFFTYAKSSEYPKMRFRNHKIIYLSLGVNDVSTDIFNQLCSRFGGFVDYNDELDHGWQKIERQPLPEEAWEALTNADEPEEALTEQQAVRQILKLEDKGERQEENRERRKNNRPERQRNEKQERREETQRNGHNERKDGNRSDGKRNYRPRNNHGRNGQRNKANNKQGKIMDYEDQADSIER